MQWNRGFKYGWNEEIVFQKSNFQNKIYFQIKFIFFTIEGLSFFFFFFIINCHFEIE
jgi:hypothetical protein